MCSTNLETVLLLNLIAWFGYDPYAPIHAGPGIDYKDLGSTSIAAA